MSDPISGGLQGDPLVGQVVGGKYQIVRLVARGGMSRVYRATQLPLGRPVALKLLQPLTATLGPDSELRGRFFREAATYARLRHPNTVTIHDYGAIEGTNTLFMAMEFVEGRNLAQEIRAVGPLEPARAVRIACEVLRSLHEAHSVGIVHRDLKSSNVMLVPTVEGESVKVVDFGIAKLLGDTETDAITVGNAVLGSPGYMSPEQIRGGPLDARADLYSVGAVLYEMLTARRPFKGENSLQTMLAHVHERPAPLREACPNPLSDELVALVDACLSKDPAQRPESAAQLHDLLRGLLPDSALQSPITLTRRTGSHTGPQPSVARRLPIVVGVAMLLTTALAALAVVSAGLALYSQLGPAAVESAAPPPAAPARRTAETPHVTLTSDPPGADVRENGELVGRTPLSLPLDPGQPLRQWVITLDGYAPAVVHQGPATDDVTVPVTLQRERPAVRPAPAAGPAPARPPPPPPPSPAPEAGAIHLSR